MSLFHLCFLAGEGVCYVWVSSQPQISVWSEIARAWSWRMNTRLDITPPVWLFPTLFGVLSSAYSRKRPYLVPLIVSNQGLYFSVAEGVNSNVEIILNLGWGVALQGVAFSTRPYSLQHFLFLPKPADGLAWYLLLGNHAVVIRSLVQLHLRIQEQKEDSEFKWRG